MQALAPLIKFSGSNGFHLMWNVPDCRELPDADLWDIEQRAVAADRDAVDRLAHPREDPRLAARARQEDAKRRPRSRGALHFDVAAALPDDAEAQLLALGRAALSDTW